MDKLENNFDDAYVQLSKNNVDSKGQLKNSPCVRFENPHGKGLRVMFVGNSITLHGPAPKIGWHGEWGMAASSKENDYVHILEREIRNTDPEASFCICQVSDFEREYWNGTEKFPQFESAHQFGADVIVLRFIENVAIGNFDKDVFGRELEQLVQFLNGSGNAKIIVTTSFWKHPGDQALRDFAAQNGYPCVELGDLGEDHSMKAIGLFEHGGVAQHPGDQGMKEIAERIMKALTPMI